jgi:hypothetical protein
LRHFIWTATFAGNHGLLIEYLQAQLEKNINFRQEKSVAEKQELGLAD